MKSYTDLEQSKKLAEILPIESADMIWVLVNPDLPMIKAIAYKDSEKNKYYEILPAWSLAALLEVLPDNEHISTTVSRGCYMISTAEYFPNIWWCEYADSKNQTEFNTSTDNLVDACYEMIIKLHELKML